MTVIASLTHYNRWRRGDLNELVLSPAQIGAAIDAAVEDLARLQRENAELREALCWYGTSSHWMRSVTNIGPRITWTKSLAAGDRGARARMALMTVGGGA